MPEHDKNQNTAVIKTFEPPLRVSEAFQGREDIIKTIKEATAVNAVQLYGIGGIGKSEICRSIFWEIADNTRTKDCVAWIQYQESLKESLFGQFNELPDETAELTPDEYMNRVKNYVNRLGHSLWLFVDNADTITTEETAWLRRLACRVILTTRTKQKRIPAFEISHLPEKDALKIYQDNSEDQSDDSIPYIKQILQLADYHTQTVELLARTQYASHMSANDLLQRLQKGGFNMTGITANIDDIHADEETTALLSEHLEKIFDIAAIRDEQQLRILEGFSYLAPNTPVEADLIQSLFDLDSLDPVNELIQRGWLNVDVSAATHPISIHPVIADTVQSVCRKKAAKEGTQNASDFGRIQADYARSAPIRRLKSRLHASRGQGIKIQNALLPHCAAAAERIKQSEDRIFSSLYPDLLYEMSFIYRETGDYDSAEQYGLQALKKHGEKNPESFDVELDCSILADVYLSKGNPDKAMEYAREDERISLKKHREGTTAIAATYYLLGKIHLALNQFEQALEYAEAAKRIDEEKHGNEHPDTAPDYHLLGKIHLALNQFDQALEYAEAAKKILEEKKGKEHPDTARNYWLLGRIRLKQGQPDEALQYAAAAEKIQTEKLGSKHSYTKDTFNLLADIYEAKGDHEKAAEYRAKANE